MKPRRNPGRTAARLLVLAALVALAAPVSAGPRPELDVTAGLRPAASLRTLAARTRSSSALLAIATPASYDERYEVPTFLWATRGPGGPPGALRARSSVEADARRHLGLLADYYRLQAVDVAEAPLRYIHDTGASGVLAAFTQTVHGIDVFRDEVRVLMDRDHQLVAVSGYIPSRDLVARVGEPAFRIDPARALDVALADFSGRAATGGARFVAPAEGGYERWD